MEASGRKAALLGREDGSFEAWVYPLKVLHDFRLSFGTPAYADPIPGASLAASVDVRPEASVVRYSHAAFTVDATWLVPLNEQGGVVLLDVSTSEPLQVVVKFRVDLKPMWPAALGGQYSYWDDGPEGVRRRRGQRQARGADRIAVRARRRPNSRRTICPTRRRSSPSRSRPETAARGLVPIVIAASPDGLNGAQGHLPEAARLAREPHVRASRRRTTAGCARS